MFNGDHNPFLQTRWFRVILKIYKSFYKQPLKIFVEIKLQLTTTIKRPFFISLVMAIFTCVGLVNAQTSPTFRPNTTRDSQGRLVGAANKMKGGDSLQQRDNNEDSITIFYRMFDSSRTYRIDSTVNDYTKRFPLPTSNLYLGNLGSPTKSLIFSPMLKPGFDAGFHAFDTYKFTTQNTRVFQTTRPYTELDYLLGGKSEQTIKILHTQNIRPAWNAMFEYKFINTPGHFKNSNTSHSAIRFATAFATRDKRYSGNAMFITNRNRASENGGIRSDTFLHTINTAYNERFNIPTWLGGDGSFGSNFFTSSISTGSEQKTKTFFLRHQYDLGQKDSTYDADSAVIHLFYPRFRLQHTFSYTSSYFNFSDANSTNSDYNEVYQKRYGLTIIATPLSLTDKWKDLTNEAAIEVFPEKNNQEQFLKAGAGYQMLQGSFASASENFSNLYLLGEYRNRTRNRKWDMEAGGKFYLAGLNGGDYNATISLQRDLGKKLGTLQVGFQNINRAPSLVFDTRSSYLVTGNTNFNKENWTVLNGNLYITRLKLHLLANYYIVSNYTYWDDYFHAQQQGTLQNVLHIGAEKTFRISKHWNWYADFHFQQATGSDINLPTIYTRHRFEYEGQFYKNLTLAAGVEMRYFTPYKTDDWSPFNQQWVVRNETTITNRPDIAAFLHFRIRGLRIYIRAENLNTVDFSNGFTFTHNNLAAPLYPTPGFFFRFGFYWAFVN